MIKIKRVYDPPSKDDGCRILIDRLWPRGLSKQKAKLDDWIKEVAPSNGLRQWFSHEADKWEEFKRRYREELSEKQDLLNRIRQLEKENGTISLVYSARDTEHNNAVALKEIIGKRNSKVPHVLT